MDYWNTMGGRIKRLREENGLTQAALAEKMEVKRETIYQWETGARDIKTQAIVKLADCLDVDCDYILRGVKSKNVTINRRLGLSDGAIEVLEQFKKDGGALTKIVNLIIEKGSKYQIFLALNCFFGNAAVIDFEKIKRSIKYRAPAGTDKNFATDIIFSDFEDGLLNHVTDACKRIKSGAKPKGSLSAQIDEAAEHFNDGIEAPDYKTLWEKELDMEDTSDGVHREE